mmetsp:Transcript_38013/g.90299  ORF Transcript_38013/g.90299 Transcript_38013/m.90299 type:complete len:230 (+) Transcript_38013:1202-1891(+)
MAALPRALLRRVDGALIVPEVHAELAGKLQAPAARAHTQVAAEVGQVDRLALAPRLLRVRTRARGGAVPVVHGAERRLLQPTAFVHGPRPRGVEPVLLPGAPSVACPVGCLEAGDLARLRVPGGVKPGRRHVLPVAVGEPRRGALHLHPEGRARSIADHEVREGDVLGSPAELGQQQLLPKALLRKALRLLARAEALLPGCGLRRVLGPRPGGAVDEQGRLAPAGRAAL